MEYYRFALDNPGKARFSEFALPPEIRDEVWLKLYEGRPTSLDSPVVFERVIRGAGRPGRLADFLTSNLGTLLLSDRLFSVLRPLLPSCQVFDAEIHRDGATESSEYKLVNLLAVFDCFDYKRSRYWFTPPDRSKQLYYGNILTRWLRRKYLVSPGGPPQVTFVHRPTLRRHSIPDGCHAFRVKPIQGQFVFVSDHLRDTALASGCTGLAFEHVDSSAS